MSSPADGQPRPGEKGDQFPTGPEAIAFALGELTGKVANLRTDLKEWREDVKTTALDQEKRIATIEKWHVKVTALFGAGGTILGLIAQWIIHNVHF